MLFFGSLTVSSVATVSTTETWESEHGSRETNKCIINNFFLNIVCDTAVAVAPSGTLTLAICFHLPGGKPSFEHIWANH